MHVLRLTRRLNWIEWQISKEFLSTSTPPIKVNAKDISMIYYIYTILLVNMSARGANINPCYTPFTSVFINFIMYLARYLSIPPKPPPAPSSSPFNAITTPVIRQQQTAIPRDVYEHTRNGGGTRLRRGVESKYTFPKDIYDKLSCSGI